jgi:hypothetical protein
MATEKFELQRVHYMPKDLKPGVLYVSHEFGAAAHLCACGCGAKIRTPLGPTEWTVDEAAGGPSVWPSIGNWQRPCQSHYIIYRGRVQWEEKWSPEQILAGRRKEEDRRRVHYDALYREHGLWGRFWSWLKSKFQ